MVLQVVLVSLAAWVAVSVVLALLIGRAVRLADRRHRRMLASPLRAAPVVVRAKVAVKA